MTNFILGQVLAAYATILVLDVWLCPRDPATDRKGFATQAHDIYRGQLRDIATSITGYGGGACRHGRSQQYRFE
jgi:hypothetical protein